MFCYSCSHEIKLEGGIGRRDSCPQCDVDLHCCRNCTFYDTSKSNDCAEPSAEWVSNKTAANFCEYFEPNLVTHAASARSATANDVRSAFEALFKK